MNAKPMLPALLLYTLAATLAVGAARPSWFEARTTGDKLLTLRGAAEFGSGASGTTDPAPFVLTLGADSPMGAVLFTQPGGTRPKPGVYQIGPAGEGVTHAMVVTGSPTQPTGVFRARGGTLTVTESRDDFMAGHFEMEAVGFEAANTADEDRELTVRGVFTAAPSARPRP